MFALSELPPPVRLHLYATLLEQRPIPLTELLVLSYEINHFIRRQVYRHVALKSLRQLESFGKSSGAQRWGKDARSLCVHLGGGSTIAGVSPLLGMAIELTSAVNEINLVCYTLRVDPHRHFLLQGLKSINPIRFSWSSPDPSHQFTIATFSTHLTPIFTSYTRLAYLSLSNVSFATLDDPSRGEAPFPVEDGRMVHGGEGWVGGIVQGIGANAVLPVARNTFSLPDALIGVDEGGGRLGGCLKEIRLEKAVFLHPEIVLNLVVDVEMAKARLRRPRNGTEAHATDEAAMVKRSSHFDDDENDDSSRLKVILEDVYMESIWGSRLRLQHLQTAAMKLGISSEQLKGITVVGRCERLHGGDRFQP